MIKPAPASGSPLLQSLKDWRRGRASLDKVPAFVIFHDAVLLEISSARPRTLAALSRIKGIGESKMNRYGEEVLRIVGKGAAATN